MQKNFFTPIGIIVMATALVSIAYSFYYHDRPRVDAHAYDRIGWNLARGLGYIEIEANAANPRSDDAIVRVGPGYQFFLAGIYTVVGHKIWVVWIIHALLRGASVYILYRLAVLLFSSSPHSIWNGRMANAAAALFGFSPDLIMINGLLLTETLFLFLLIGAVYLSLRLVTEERNLVLAAGASVVWAYAILTRPVALLPFFLFMGVLLWRKNWRSAAMVFLLPVVCVSLWSYRMTARYDHFIVTTTAGWYDMWVGNNPHATGGFEKSQDIQEFRDETYDSTVLDRIGRQKYFEFLTEQPLRFLELQWRKAALYFSLLRPGGYWIHLLAHPWDLRISLAASWIGTSLLFTSGLAGAYIVLRYHDDMQSRLFLAFAVLQPLAVIPIIVETRYRYALFPFLAVFGAYFLVLFMESNSLKENGNVPQIPLSSLRRVLVVAVIALMVFTGYDFWYNFVDIVTKINRVV